MTVPRVPIPPVADPLAVVLAGCVAVLAVPAAALGTPTLACDFPRGPGGLTLVGDDRVVPRAADFASIVSAEAGVIHATRASDNAPLHVTVHSDGRAWLTDWFGPTGPLAVAGTCGPA